MAAHLCKDHLEGVRDDHTSGRTHARLSPPLDVIGILRIVLDDTSCAIREAHHSRRDKVLEIKEHCAFGNLFVAAIENQQCIETTSVEDVRMTFGAANSDTIVVKGALQPCVKPWTCRKPADEEQGLWTRFDEGLLCNDEYRTY